MKLSLLCLGLVAAVCSLSAKADTSTRALSSVEAALVAAVLNLQSNTTLAATTASSTAASTPTSASSTASLSRRERYNLGNILAKRSDYVTLTNGTNPIDGSAALKAPGYLTYKVISNTTTYSAAKAACLNYCDSTKGCIAANMYQEINNPLLDLV